MKKFVASTDTAELTGAALSSIATNLLAESYRPILETHNLSDIDPDAWYSQQIPLDILREIKMQAHESLALVAVGQQVIEVIDPAQLPSVESLAEGVGLLSNIYDLNHRNKAKNDRIIVKLVNANLIQVINSTPYPDDLIYGYVHSMTRRFASPDADLVVRYDDLTQIDSDGAMVINIEF